MKINNAVSALAFALAITLASTGCRHQPVGVTHIPGSSTPEIPSPGIGNTLNGENGPTSVGTPPGTIALSGSWDPINYTQDSAALAADTIHFAYDSAVVRDSDQANLQAVAQQMATDPNLRLIIQGNCDERGTEEYNRSLGERRAEAARETLSKFGLDPSRVRTISFGKDKPADSGHDEAAWSKNRRDDFVLCHPKSGV